MASNLMPMYGTFEGFPEEKESIASVGDHQKTSFKPVLYDSWRANLPQEFSTKMPGPVHGKVHSHVMFVQTSDPKAVSIHLLRRYTIAHIPSWAVSKAPMFCSNLIGRNILRICRYGDFYLFSAVNHLLVKKHVSNFPYHQGVEEVTKYQESARQLRNHLKAVGSKERLASQIHAYYLIGTITGLDALLFNVFLYVGSGLPMRSMQLVYASEGKANKMKNTSEEQLMPMKHLAAVINPLDNTSRCGSGNFLLNLENCFKTGISRLRFKENGYVLTMFSCGRKHRLHHPPIFIWFDGCNAYVFFVRFRSRPCVSCTFAGLMGYTVWFGIVQVHFCWKTLNDLTNLFPELTFWLVLCFMSKLFETVIAFLSSALCLGKK